LGFGIGCEHDENHFTRYTAIRLGFFSGPNMLKEMVDFQGYIQALVAFQQEFFPATHRNYFHKPSTLSALGSNRPDPPQPSAGEETVMW